MQFWKASLTFRPGNTIEELVSTWHAEFHPKCRSGHKNNDSCNAYRAFWNGVRFAKVHPEMLEQIGFFFDKA